MKLQNILMPQSNVCIQQDMYFRLNQYAHMANCHQEIYFETGGDAWFDTYFNSFSIEKWRKYTKIGQVSVSLYLQGDLEIQLFSKEKIHGCITEKELSITKFSSETPEWITLPFFSYEEKGMYALRLEGISDGARFLGGFYSGEIEEKDCFPVQIAINICTFRREAFVKRNLDILNQKILENQEHPLYRNLQIFISDNGKTLDIDSLSSEKIHIVPNKNVGGAGGFTRGLLEIMHCASFRATHALFMDDDVLIEPESLFRTYMLLHTIKDQYKDAFIGGAMLRLDQQNVQVEAGAAWYAGSLASRKSNLNLNSVDACLYNEIEEFYEYNAWWYCCIPMSVVNPQNLPMPIFIRGDDLEYGLRNMKQLILLNGICVWHEPFENKYSSFLEYYILRNMLYDNALHCPGYSKWDLIRWLCGRVIRQLMYYRYQNIDLMFRAIDDFYKGVQFLQETDGEALHQEIMASGYKAQPVETLPMPFEYPIYEYSFKENESKGKRMIRMLTLNGIFLPAKRANITSMAQCRPINFYRAKRVLQYDVTSKKGFITEKSIRKTIKYLFELIGVTFNIIFRFESAKKNFIKNASSLTNETFWYRYLELSENNER